MRTGVVIGGRQYFYDLDRMSSFENVLEGDDLLVVSPVSEELCRVRVVKVTDRGVMVEEIRDKPAAVFWKISKREIFRVAYKINYHPGEIPQ